MKKDNVIPFSKKNSRKNKKAEPKDNKREIEVLPLHKLLHEILFTDENDQNNKQDL